MSTIFLAKAAVVAKITEWNAIKALRKVTRHHPEMENVSDSICIMWIADKLAEQ